MKKLGNVLIQLMEDLSELSTNGEAHVRINRSIAEPQEFKQLFDYFTKGTVLERVDLTVEPMHARMNCVCGFETLVDGSKHNGYEECPDCGRFADIENKEYELVEPNPRKVNPKSSVNL